MFSLISAGFSAAPEIGVDGAVDLGRGAIAGAFVIGAAFLAGYAVFRRASAAVCGLVMVLAAAALEFSWLGLIRTPPAQVMVLLQGMFGAAAIVFLSSTIRTARNNALLGGVMFAAALSLVGIGIINLIGRSDVSGLMRAALGCVGGFAVLLTLSQSLRDSSARLIVPGAITALAAAGVALSGTSFSLLPHALFTFGILAASLVALTEVSLPRVRELGLHPVEPSAALTPQPASLAAPDPERALRVSENQLAQVLDYTGVTVWDWSPEAAHQTEGLFALMGADCHGTFTPESMRAFIHKDDVDRFEKQILAPSLGDGSFDLTLKLHDGRAVRMRGARAVSVEGELERLVAFVEPASNGKFAKAVAAAPPAKEPEKSAASLHPLAGAFAQALEKGDIQAVFQPIVRFETGVVVGYEALARWREEKEGADRATAEELVRAAQASGKGRALAMLILNAAADYLSEQMKLTDRADLFVAVNLSVAQISEAGFSHDIRALIAKKQLPPRALVLELTETEALTDLVAAEKIFGEMKAAGAALAFDDFGAGFSSLANLGRFEFDYLKIDKSFVAGAAAGGGPAKIVRAMAALGRDMGLTVIAEGVETPELVDAARDLGCVLGQGFALGVPAASGANETGTGDVSKEQSKRAFFGGGLR